MNVVDASIEFGGTYTQLRSTTRYIVVHHAAWTYPPGIAAVESVHRYHKEKWGTGIGYHEALAKEADGSITCYKTSVSLLQRYGVAYRNHESFHISALTNFGDDMPGQEWIDALTERVHQAQMLWPRAEVVGHKEIAVAGWETACPGKRWSEWKGRLLRLPAEEMWRTPHWYQVPPRVIAMVRYEPRVVGDTNVAAMLTPGTRVHVAMWTNDWGSLSSGGFVHRSGVQPE